VSDEVVILVDGKRQDAAPTAPTAPVLRVRVRDRADEAARLLSGLASVASVVPDEEALQVTLAIGVADAGDLAASLVRGGFTLTALEPIQTSLANTFRDIVARSRNGGRRS
jgi:hypothetical protein